MIVHEHIIQGSEDWFRIRKGKPTASRFSDIITAARGDLSKSSVRYIRELIGECFCPDFIGWTGNKFTDRGTELEPEARDAFTQLTGLTVRQVGFVTRDDTIVGCSPDGLLTDATGNYVAGLELKCPMPATHVGYVLDGALPNEYKQQVHGGMAVTGLNEWHFFSYFPGMKPHHVIVKRDDYTAKLSAAVDQFLIEYQAYRAAVIPRLKA